MPRHPLTGDTLKELLKNKPWLLSDKDKKELKIQEDPKRNKIRKDIQSLIDDKIKEERTGMNGIETRMAGELESLQKQGKIYSWQFESVNLKLTKKTWYRPDFLVTKNDGTLQFLETKGHLRDDANAKFKMAVHLYPTFEFQMVKWDRKSKKWEIVHTFAKKFPKCLEV